MVAFPSSHYPCRLLCCFVSILRVPRSVSCDHAACVSVPRHHPRTIGAPEYLCVFDDPSAHHLLHGAWIPYLTLSPAAWVVAGCTHVRVSRSAIL